MDAKKANLKKTLEEIIRHCPPGKSKIYLAINRLDDTDTSHKASKTSLLHGMKNTRVGEIGTGRFMFDAQKENATSMFDFIFPCGVYCSDEFTRWEYID